MRAVLYWIIGAAVLIGIVACSSTPDHVIPKDKMAHLLADLHTAESVAEIERGHYRDDSMKKVLKQSVFMKYGVTQEQVDTSFDWYGHNIKDYIEVYDRTIEILNEKVDEIDATAENIALTVFGDSVDIWSGARMRIFSDQQPAQYVDFVLQPDENWEPGDSYEWRIKMLNNRSPLEWGLYTDYADGSTEYITASESQEGWNSLSLHLDSTRTATRIYGYATVRVTPNERVFLDSIALLRTRAQQGVRVGLRSGQTLFRYGAEEDTEDAQDERR